MQTRSLVLLVVPLGLFACSDAGSGAQSDASNEGTDSNASVDAASDSGDSSDASTSDVAIATCAKSTSAWTTTAPFGYQRFGNYVVQNNDWGNNPGQSTWANSETCWGALTPKSTVEVGGVNTYPNVTRGWTQNAGVMQSFSTTATNDWTTKCGLGLNLPNIKKARIHWSFDAPTTGSTAPRWMALQDIYFHKSATPSPSEFPPVTDLMIDEALADQAVGNTSYYALVAQGDHAQKVTIGGQDFLVYIDDTGEAAFHKGGHTIHLFHTPTSGLLWGTNTTTVDLKAIIDYFRQSSIPLVDSSGKAVVGPLLTDDLYLTSINSGWEIDVGTAFQTNAYWVAVQDELDGPI